MITETNKQAAMVQKATDVAVTYMLLIGITAVHTIIGSNYLYPKLTHISPSTVSGHYQFK